MKKIAARLTFSVFSVHLLLAFFVGLSVEPLKDEKWFIWTIVLVIVLLLINIIRLEDVFKNKNKNQKKEKISLTKKNRWFWMLCLLSSLAIGGIMYYGSQMLLPIEEMSQRFTFNDSAYQWTALELILCGSIYILLLIWIKKTLKNIWGR